MAKLSTITVIKDKNLRGIIAPAEVISKDLLENMIDLVELSSKEMTKDSKVRIKEADRRKSWMSLGEVRKLSAKAK